MNVIIRRLHISQKAIPKIAPQLLFEKKNKQTNEQTKTKSRIEDNYVTTDAHLSISLFFSFINISCSLLNLVLKAKKVVMLCKKNRQYTYAHVFYLLVEIYFCL